jgi:hypothetical protein
VDQKTFLTNRCALFLSHSQQALQGFDSVRLPLASNLTTNKSTALKTLSFWRSFKASSFQQTAHGSNFGMTGALWNLHGLVLWIGIDTILKPVIAGIASLNDKILFGAQNLVSLGAA